MRQQLILSAVAVCARCDEPDRPAAPMTADDLLSGRCSCARIAGVLRSAHDLKRGD